MSNQKINLTARELQVLELMSQGNNSVEIAKSLYLSANTVEYHRKQLLRKTGARNAAHLMSFAFRHRLLS